MRIAILFHYLTVAGGLSVGKNLARFLPEIGLKHDYLMFIPKGLGYEEILQDRENVQFVVVDIPSIIKRRIYDNVTLPRLIDEFQADVIFGAGNLGLKSPKCRQVILFHRPQLIYPFRYARMDMKTALRTILVKKAVAGCLEKTDIVFCQTPVARKRFSESFNYPLENIKIMSNAVSEFSKMLPEQADVPSIFENKKTFDLFYLTKFYSHKNLEILIDMFRENPERLKDIRCIVTIAPNQHPDAPAFLKAIEKYELQKKIVNVGPLEQHDLAGYFYNCDALIFPTLLESFSGTYLEAMHFGLPILTSDIDFARYVCEDAALYFDPWDASDIARKICELKSNTELQMSLREKGSKRMVSFFKPWKAIAKETLVEIEKLNK